MQVTPTSFLLKLLDNVDRTESVDKSYEWFEATASNKLLIGSR